MPHASETVVIVTGASRGLGQAIALAFARTSALVIGFSRGEQSETAAKASQLGGQFTGITADLGTLTQTGASELLRQVLKVQNS